VAGVRRTFGFQARQDVRGVGRILGKRNNPSHINMFKMRKLIGYSSPSMWLREEFQVSFLALWQ
jgi:hypothetical protein